ncbi:hypothetical protein EV643_12161 [Kribbella sp. VKM Ac-2527]|uniref:Copper resistance protein D n=1 Tax=Kribbella caucasensis TaxID=2512215 RepID=A0A4R6JID1_9ACTN|nr:hypothetical protein [Kribbella sp. VKM Ac-2527]TDO35789.1 hypothetical protein EV643_12161 [Kribbella sp. VKM Ac-2527]
MNAVTALVAIAHAGLAAAWIGGMTYSLFVIQPKLKKFYAADEESREALTTVIASGNRWMVLGLIAAIALTGVGLLLLTHTNWWIHALKAALLLAATTIFWYVSWHHWPHRVFATSTERPAYQGQLRLLATVMLALTSLAFALGVASVHLT